MDPLSLTVSILTLLGAGGSIAGAFEKLRSLRQAPEALHALNNEISDLHLIVLETNTLLQEHQDIASINRRTQDFAANLKPILDRAREKLLELESLIVYRLTTPGPSNEPNINKSAWMRERKRMKMIQTEIHTIRMDLVAAVGILSFRIALRVELQLSELRYISNSILSQQDQTHVLTSQTLVSQGNLERAMPDVIRAQDRAEHTLNDLLRAYTAVRGDEVVRTPESGSSQHRHVPRGGNGGYWSLQLQPVHRRPQSVCRSGCTCSCHTRSSWRSSSYLQSILGLLFIGYTGLPLVSSGCNNIRCQRRSDPVISIKYFFPSWFMARALDVVILISRPDGLVQSLRVSRIVWEESKIFRLAQDGNVDDMKSLLSSRRGSPYDVSSLYGFTPLDQAVKCGQITMCQFLLDAGADPHSESIEHVTPSIAAWRIILTRPSHEQKKADELRIMFPDPEFESWQFTPLHRAVLRLTPLSLEEAFQESPHLVNEGDLNGCTALSWSAWRGNCEAVHYLLQKGANHSSSDRFMNLPLSYAVRSPSYQCARILLEHGANANAIGPNGETPLHLLAKKRHSAGLSNKILDLLVRYQENVNARKPEGESPLESSIRWGNQKLSMRLIGLDADIHAQDTYGGNALYWAVRRNAHSTLRLLLQRGADHIGHIKEDGSFLHLAAESADCISLLLLADAFLNPRKIQEKRQEDGLTAIDVARSRTDVTEEWIDAFQAFLESVDQDRNHPREARQSFSSDSGASISDESDGQEETYVDAPEEQG